ncbi:MAG TPA: hypothetical protein EYN91_13590 [Candidatus Melainabacteria bacterium]|nr:hypothetical protein [Candidatus Melainabacteria bacterium]
MALNWRLGWYFVPIRVGDEYALTMRVYSVFTSHRLWLRDLPRRYAWILGSLAGFLVGAMAAWSLSSSTQIGTFRWCLGIFIGLTIPGQTLALCNMTNAMFELAGPGWWKRRKVAATYHRPSSVANAVELKVPNCRSDAMRRPGDASHRPYKDNEPVATGLVRTDDESYTATTEEIRAMADVSPSSIPQKSHSRIVTDTSVFHISFTGDRVNVRVGRQLSNRKWKILHAELRRIPSIVWDDAQKAKPAEGGVERSVSGIVRMPPIKGKKNRQKRRVAREQHLNAIAKRLQELAEQHSSN